MSRRAGMLPEDQLRMLRRFTRDERGSAILLMTFACLVIAVVLQGLSTVILCVERAVADESSGRVLLTQKDSALADVRQGLLERWETHAPTWSMLADGVSGVRVQAAVEEIPEVEDLLMKVSVRHEPSVSRWVVSVSAERGRDGIDLPLAAVVAGSIEAKPGRESTWVDADPSSGLAGGSAPEGSAGPSSVRCHIYEPVQDPVLGPTCVVTSLASRWRLDPGWALAANPSGVPVESGGNGAGMGSAVAAPPAFAASGGAHLLSGDPGHLLSLPAELGGGSPEAPLLVLLSGGADLDAEGLGDFFGVIVVDGGSVRLEGTVLHGAVFATDVVELGETGRILFSPGTLRWATDQSLQRVRLVPGTRWEGME